jgi:PEP-CTERM motif
MKISERDLTMNYLRIGARLAAGAAALALSLSAGAVTVSLVGDANPDELQVVISGLGASPATDVSAFDIGLSFSGVTLTAGNMSLNLAVLDDGSGSYGSCAMGSDGSTATGGFGGCPASTPGGVKADLAFVSFLDDATLAGIQNPGSASNFSLTLATLDFSGAVNPSTVSLVWGDGFHDVKGNNTCLDPTGAPGAACVIFNGNPSVPEPGTLALLGFGVVAGAAGLRRRSRR